MAAGAPEPKRARMAGGESSSAAAAAATEDPEICTRASWIEFDPKTHGFSLQNIPWGVGKRSDTGDQVCMTRIGDFCVDLSVLVKRGFLRGTWASTLMAPLLNDFMAENRAAWKDARAQLQKLFDADTPDLRDNEEARAAALLPADGVTMVLPARIGDYTDAYSSISHATNVGQMFRPGGDALLPNWKYLPVAYHGRASSVVVSGRDIRRPKGQLQKDAADPKQGSTFGPCRLMDYEMEMATWIGGKENEIGTPVKIEEAEDRIFGFGLMNDWSARDIQKWEYVPLGPFTAKNLMTTVSPWIISVDALAPFKAAPTSGKQDPEPHPYLCDPDYRSYDVHLEVGLAPEGSTDTTVLTRTNFRNLYWTPKQQLTHHTVTGCNLRAGDVIGSGTISGEERESFGSLLELCWKGTREVGPLKDGSTRKFLKDGDLVVMKGQCRSDDCVIDFGECSGRLLPALD